MNADAERVAVREAARWLVQLHGNTCGAAEREALARWRASAEVNERAWQRAERLQAQMAAVPAALAVPALSRASRGRRDLLKSLAGLAVIPAAGWLAWRHVPWQAWTADLRTARGEQRQLRLPDGSWLTLDTASAVDVSFDDSARRVWLRAGAVYLATAPDPRPLSVITVHGEAQALGTRFAVALEQNSTHVSVAEGRVRAQPARGEGRIVAAGQSVRFDALACDAPTVLSEHAIAWTRGVLYADNMRLEDFVAQLSRYRSGVVRCDPRVADLRISGAFQLADTDQVMAMVAAAVPVRVTYRTRYWVEFTPV
ncbi:DUF4880 domain-containing protein [Pigmentiphaga aceris]|uniref:DUF4880 domain-containing protein n=1 Tax=Pigmentiphaga aceris TaxID=1940612 RepID=A0A5C0AZM3_9BURK|nr:FecR domain-containing protein [Pigmentiphaga aceris]QEI07146.1 DUF4880 domain-containing protein [Pigmentiphaga aceris]